MEETANGNCVERRVIRVYVEPVELELDDDNTLLITSLQSALPGASGMYFNGECKSSVKFDGKKLLPPAGGWNDRKYFATLGARSFDYPFGTYANASKQFERSVNAVQRMLGSSKLFDCGTIEQEMSMKKKAPTYSLTTAVGAEKAESMKQLLSTIAQKQAPTGQSPPATTNGDQSKITPIEQQFVDLARISTAKDAIIEQQRADIKVEQEKLDHKEKILKETLEDVTKFEKRCAAQEEELMILRNLSKEQTYMCEKVNELTKQHIEEDNKIFELREHIEQLTAKIAVYEKERSAMEDNIERLEEIDRIARATIEQLQLQLNGLRPLAEIRQISYVEDGEQVLSYVEMSDSLKALKEQNEKLENEMNAMDEKYQQLDKMYAVMAKENTQLAIRCSDYEKESGAMDTRQLTAIDALKDQKPPDSGTWEQEREELKSELVASENKVAELTRMVHSLTKEATTSERRMEESLISRNEMRRSLDLAETKIQITISK